MDGEFPKNLKYLWNHPELSQKTKEKIAYHNGKEYFQLDRPASADPVASWAWAYCSTARYLFALPRISLNNLSAGWRSALLSSSASK
jgi:hypothetical protein